MFRRVTQRMEEIIGGVPVLLILAMAGVFLYCMEVYADPRAGQSQCNVAVTGGISCSAEVGDPVIISQISAPMVEPLAILLFGFGLTAFGVFARRERK